MSPAHRVRLAALGSLAFLTTAALPAVADGLHTPTTPTACTVSSTGRTATCSFTASALYAQQAMVIGQPHWSATAQRHGKTRRITIDLNSCPLYRGSTQPAYMCWLPVHPGDRVTIMIRSTGMIRAGDDVCAEDPICMGPGDAVAPWPTH